MLFKLSAIERTVAELFSHVERRAHGLEEPPRIRRAPEELPDVVVARCDAALVADGGEELEAPIEVTGRHLERPRVAVEPPDAIVSGAALALEPEAVRETEHLAERGEGLVGASEHDEHVAVIVQGVDAAAGVVVAEQLEPLSRSARGRVWRRTACARERRNRCT
jgi:hypothetical protein